MARTSPETIEKDTPPAVHKRRGRPKETDPGKEASENSHSFFESCGRIDPRDWGTRASIYVYRKEPIIDRSHSGDYHYIDKYQELITEDRVLADHGSGKYRLMLNFQKPGSQTSSTIDTAILTLMNVKFPPKIAPGDWVDDPKNSKWAWAKDSFPKPASPNGTGQVLETLKVFNDIRKGVQEDKPDVPPPPPPLPNPVTQVRETIQALKELAPQPAPATENKTFDAIVQLMLGQMQQQAAQNTTLLQAVLQQRNSAPQASLTETISVLSDKLLPLVEKLKPGAEEALTNFTRRSKMSGWMEMIQPAIPAALEFFKPLMVGIAQRMMQPVPNGATGFTPPASPGAGQLPASQPAVPGSAAGFPPILNMIAVPLLNWMRMDADPRELGQDFASWVHEGLSADPRFAQALALARASGANAVLIAFKGSPYWLDKGLNHDKPSLAEMEPKFTVFLESFLQWKPSADEQDDDDVIDITGGDN
jgi:hypothetical protein